MAIQNYTIDEICRRFNVSFHKVIGLASANGWELEKKYIDNRYRYIISEEIVNKMFNIPSHNELDISTPNVIYVNTIYEIYPSKMNYKL